MPRSRPRSPGVLGGWLLRPGSVECSTLAGIEGGLAVDVFAQAADRGEDAVADGLHPLDVAVVRIELEDDRLAAAWLQTIGPECLSYSKVRAGLGIVDLPVAQRFDNGMLPQFGDHGTSLRGLGVRFVVDDRLTPGHRAYARVVSFTACNRRALATSESPTRSTHHETPNRPATQGKSRRAIGVQ